MNIMRWAIHVSRLTAETYETKLEPTIDNLNERTGFDIYGKIKYETIFEIQVV